MTRLEGLGARRNRCHILYFSRSYCPLCSSPGVSWIEGRGARRRGSHFLYLSRSYMPPRPETPHQYPARAKRCFPDLHCLDCEEPLQGAVKRGPYRSVLRRCRTPNRMAWLCGLFSAPLDSLSPEAGGLNGAGSARKAVDQTRGDSQPTRLYAVLNKR